MCIALHGNPSQSYGASLAIRDHIVLPATRQANVPSPVRASLVADQIGVQKMTEFGAYFLGPLCRI